MILSKTLEILEDGKIKVVFFDDNSTYLQPILVANRYDETEFIRLHGQPNKFVNIDVTVETINGVAFSGNYDDLNIAIADLMNEANAIFNGSFVDSGDATEATQLDIKTIIQGLNLSGLAQEATQLLVKVAVQAIASSGATAAKQDQIKTAVDAVTTAIGLLAKKTETQPVSMASAPTGANLEVTQLLVKTAVESLALNGATATKQDELKTATTDGTQKTQLYQDAALVSKNNGAWVKFSNDSITKSASGALLVNSPTILFDGKTLNADDTNFLWQSVGTGSGSWANNMFSMSVTAGQYYIRQSRRFMPYFSGYPVLAELTFDNFDIQANGTKRLGYFSSSATAPHTANLDGFWLEMDGTTYRMVSYNNGTQTSNVAFSSFTNYATLSTYNFDNFTACMFSFLWLGGAQLALWLCTANDGWILANLTPYVGNNKGTICNSPNQPIRYEIRSTTGTLDFRQVCCQVSVGGNMEKLGYSLPSVNSAAIQCNTVGTIYALQGFKKNATYKDIAVKIQSLGCVNGATTDTGLLMIIRNPTLSAPLTYAAYGKIDRAIATTQTVTAGTGDIIAITAAGSTGDANDHLEDNYKAWLTQTITNTFDEYVLCYLSTSSNQDVRGYAVLKEY